MPATKPNAFIRLFRGETSFDFAGRWRRWFAISGIIIVIGLVSIGVRGINFSIDFKGGSVWDVPTATATVADARNAVNQAVAGFGNSATITVLTNTETKQRTLHVEAAAKITGNSTEVSKITDALAKMAGVSNNAVTLNDIGPSWGSEITNKAIEAVIIFLIVVSLYIWLRFEGKMAAAALVALVHDLLITAGIYSLSGFTVSPDTVTAFLTILGYSLYDTIVVFDRVQENTRGLASSNRMTYSDTVNLSMNQVLARSLNTSLVAILPILSILVIGAWVLGATALNDFGLALFIGLTTGAYSSIFIASPLLALMKEREPRYAEIRRRLDQARPRRLTPAAAAEAARAGTPVGEMDDDAPAPRRVAVQDLPDEVAYGGGDGDDDLSAGTPGSIPLRTEVPPRSGNRPPPRPRKKGRRR
ncbi:MAG TPA: protein translocase subunit SecF [Acidimicrobiales bacterium]|jgi:preprotein translocase subunit SecF|nr:protein translocase subunit SecF [Acidimicrobiales bacterium]